MTEILICIAVLVLVGISVQLHYIDADLGRMTDLLRQVLKKQLPAEDERLVEARLEHWKAH